MNTLSGGSIVRQKAVVEQVFQMENPASLYGPREDSKENMYVCSQAGEILKFTDNGDYQVHLTIGGQPVCIILINLLGIAFDNREHNELPGETEETLFFADVANAVIYERKENNDINVLIKDYEGNPLKGPTSLAFNKDENSLLICDGGYFGSTSLNRPLGSAYLIELDTNICKPLLLNCLAYPADVYYENSNNIAYLAETFANRIIRFAQNPPGVYHGSVFHQFSGRIGPTAISIDEIGNIYVARFEYQSAENDVDGIISVLNKEGYLVGELIVPKLPEIVGMFIPREGKNKNILYFTERSFNGVQKIKLSQFAAEIDKVQDNYKLY